jgi:hypothetical protein
LCRFECVLDLVDASIWCKDLHDFVKTHFVFRFNWLQTIIITLVTFPLQHHHLRCR